MKIVLVSLFNGASIAQLALKEIGINPSRVYTSEVDKYALMHEREKFPNNIMLGDVAKIDFKSLREEITRDFDNPIIVMVGGSPCQNFSFGGNRKGMTTKCDIRITSLKQYLELKKERFQFDGQSYLFWEWARAKEELKPDFWFLENVKMYKADKDILSSAVGQKGVLINSSLVSAQNRERLYWANWEFPTIKDRGIELKDVMDYSQPFRGLGKWVYNSWGNKRKIDRLKTVHDKKATTLTTSSTHSTMYYLNKDRTMYRNLSIEEAEKLQTFPVGHTSAKGVSNSQRFKLIGNSWTLEVIKELFTPLKVLLKIKGIEKRLERGVFTPNWCENRRRSEY